MTIKIWSNQVDNDFEYTEGKIRDQSLLKGLNLTSGISLLNKWPTVIIDVTSEHKPADSFLSGPMLIVNRKFANTILEFVSSKDVEYLPVDVIYKGKKQGDYGFINVLTVCDALDRNNSEFTEFDGVIDSIDRVSFDETAVGDKAIFQLDSIEWLLCVSERLVSRIEECGYTGVVFKSEKYWRPY